MHSEEASEDAVAEGGRRVGEKERRRPRSLVSRANSIFNCSRHQDIRDFDRASKIDYSSITLRLVSSSTPFARHASPLLPCLLLFLPLSLDLPRPCSDLGPASNVPSRSSPRCAFTWTHRAPLSISPFPPRRGSRLLLSSLSLLRYRVPISGASRLHVACPNDVSERTGTTAI